MAAVFEDDVIFSEFLKLFMEGRGNYCVLEKLLL
jgi:hypothetical protein